MKNSGATAVSAKPPSAQNAATRSPGWTRAPAGALRTIPANLAAGHERQRRFELILTASLQQLREGHPRGVHLDDDASSGSERMRGLGLRQLDELQGRCRGPSPRRSGWLSSWQYLRNTEERGRRWRTCCACCTTILSTDTRPPMRATRSRRSSATTTARARRRPKAIDFTPGELLGCVSGELGLREFLEERGHQLIVTSDKDGPDSVFERELPDAEIVISQPFWPAYLTAERIAKAPKLKLALTAGHRLRPRRPAGRDRARRDGRRGHLLQQHQRVRARRDDDPGARAQLHPLLPVGASRAAGTSPTACRAPTTSRACRSAPSPPVASARPCCGG